MSQSVLEVEEHGAGYVKGNVTLQETGMLVFAIPVEKGWTLYVNGQETPLEAFKEALLAVTLEEGTYEIELKFRTPGVGIGLGVSAICIALFAICWNIEKKRKVWR